MVKLIDEFRRGWQGTSEPSPLFSIGFAASCLALATAARWGLSLIRPDVFFIPYFPAVFFVTAFSGYRLGVGSRSLGSAAGVKVHFREAPTAFAKQRSLSIHAAQISLTRSGGGQYRRVDRR